MALTIEIKSRGMNAMNVIGWVTFDENPVHLQVHRTANGFNLQLPIEISLAFENNEAEAKRLLNELGFDQRPRLLEAIRRLEGWIEDVDFDGIFGDEGILAKGKRPKPDA